MRHQASPLKISRNEWGKGICAKKRPVDGADVSLSYYYCASRCAYLYVSELLFLRRSGSYGWTPRSQAPGYSSEITRRRQFKVTEKVNKMSSGPPLAARVKRRRRGNKRNRHKAVSVY